MSLSQMDSPLPQARQFLTDNPFDAGHDLAHAEAVWATAQDISKHIVLDPGSKRQTDSGSAIVDLNALKLACFWHDVVVKPRDELHSAGHNVADTASFLEARLQEFHFDSAFITTSIKAVRYHQFEDTPVNLEGQILWDADKLEVLNLDRWLSSQNAVVSGQMSQSTLDAYLDTGFKGLQILRPKFHFDYSLALFDQRLQNAAANPQIQTLACQ